MALVTFGGGVAQMRGRLGGTIFSHNRGGNYAKNFVKPTNPASPEQVAVRGRMTLLVDKWISVLTALQRTGWKTYGDNVAMTNKVGDTIFLTGQQHYIRSNSPRLQAGLSRIDDAPVIFDLGNYTQPTMSLTGGASGDILVAFTEGDQWVSADNAGMIVGFSRQQNPTINYFMGPFQFADSIDGDSATPPTTPETITSPFLYAADNKAFGHIRVSQADGRLSTPVIISAIAA